MDQRRCDHCHKKLPKGLRVDARFCPGSRCRVGAMRKRRKDRLIALLGPTRQDERAILASLQQTRKSHGWKPFLQDHVCQLKAEIIACEILAEHYRVKRWQLWNQQFKQGLPWWSTEELRFKKGYSLFIDKDVSRVGLVTLPADCEVSAVLVTSRRP